jgi:hypothetical protein
MPRSGGENGTASGDLDGGWGKRACRPTGTDPHRQGPQWTRLLATSQASRSDAESGAGPVWRRATATGAGKDRYVLATCYWELVGGCKRLIGCASPRVFGRARFRFDAGGRCGVARRDLTIDQGLQPRVSDPRPFLEEREAGRPSASTGSASRVPADWPIEDGALAGRCAAPFPTAPVVFIGPSYSGGALCLPDPHRPTPGEGLWLRDISIPGLRRRT